VLLRDRASSNQQSLRTETLEVHPLYQVRKQQAWSRI
jgi:hypothetical protein